MRHIVYEQSETYPIALLIKNTAFNATEIRNVYVDALTNKGADPGQLIAMDLQYNEANKAPVSLIKDYLAELMPALDSIGTKLIYCADAGYFRELTKQKGKASAHLGYVLPCKLEGYEHMEVILGVNHKSLIHDPGNEPKLRMSIETLGNKIVGNYEAPGKNIIHFENYPTSLHEIKTALNGLHIYDQLSCDIETFSLRFNEAGVGTVTFCWNQHEGIAFPVDYVSLDEPEDNIYGIQVSNPRVKALLREFFESYRGTVIWHNCTFDTKIFIYELWMKDALDTEGLIQGLHIMHQRIHDTKIIAYLATNTTAGNKLSLKELAHEFAGNYAQEQINDIRKIPLPQLLKYNLIDGLCTWFVYNKYHPIMQQEYQEPVYHDLMLPSQKVITQTELTGMPLNPVAVADARLKLESIANQHKTVLFSKTIITKLEDRLTYEAWRKDFEDRRGKAKNPEKIRPKERQTFPQVEFNPNSNPQLQKLLYDEMGLPVLDLTDSKLPATGGDTLKKLVNHTQNRDYLEILEALRGFSKADKILSTFIPAMERAIDKGDGVVYLHGNFNLGGTKSGRLSSSDPNLQNIPAGSVYGKLIKGCFQAPDGCLFSGADFNSLEDYISALTTKDPNKLKVYTEGYDGHCLRAFSYFPERLPGIVNTVESINSIQDNFKEVRQDSKGPTFALTYQGTWHTLVNNLGFSKVKAKEIEANYHELYQVSDEWVRQRLEEASHNGYVTVAFGLRLRTPLLAKTYRGKSSTPYEATAEGRTAGNALGQSYGLLTNRAANEFMQKVWMSRYRYDIRPVAMIHDAIYLLIKDDIEVVEWVNRELIKSMEWQELPELYHPTVKLGASLDIYYPTWAEECTLDNYASQEEIRAKCADFQTKLADKQKEAA